MLFNWVLVWADFLFAGLLASRPSFGILKPVLVSMIWQPIRPTQSLYPIRPDLFVCIDPSRWHVFLASETFRIRAEPFGEISLSKISKRLIFETNPKNFPFCRRHFWVEALLQESKRLLGRCQKQLSSSQPPLGLNSQQHQLLKDILIGDRNCLLPPANIRAGVQWLGSRSRQTISGWNHQRHNLLHPAVWIFIMFGLRIVVAGIAAIGAGALLVSQPRCGKASSRSFSE